MNNEAFIFKMGRIIQEVCCEDCKAKLYAELAAVADGVVGG